MRWKRSWCTKLVVVMVCASAACSNDEDDNRCQGVGSCDEDELEVDRCPEGADCRGNWRCGVVCQKIDCNVGPVCDTGDELQTATCPAAFSCYELSACGVTLRCIDSAEPAHGCPASEPTVGESCVPGPQPCNYPACRAFECVEAPEGGSITWQLTTECPP